MPPYTTSDGGAITSSAVTVPLGPGGAPWVCFGVAALYPAARIVCLNPHGPGERVFGRGVIRAPVDSALAYAGGDVWATDQDGGVYAFSAATGQLAAENVSPALTGGGVSIAPPAVDLTSGQVFVVGAGYSEICALRAADLRLYGCWGGSTLHGFLGDFTALTATTVSYGGQVCDLVWSATDGGSVGAGLFCPGRVPLMATYLSGLPDLRPGHNFSALVVGVGADHGDLVLWSDEAVTAWRNFAGAPQATFVASPPAGAGGGIEVWNLDTPLTAWAEGNPVPAPATDGVPRGGECVLVLARPAEFGYVTLSTRLQPDVILQDTATGVINHDGGGTGPLFSGTLRGCPPPRNGS